MDDFLAGDYSSCLLAAFFLFDLFLRLIKRNYEVLDDNAGVDHGTSGVYLVLIWLHPEKAQNYVYAFGEAWIEGKKHFFVSSDAIE